MFVIDAITDMCKVLDTQFRYDRASMRDMYRLNKFQRTEAKRNVDAVNSLDRCQTSLDFVNSTGQTNSVFNNFMNNLSSTYDTKMKRLGDAQMEEERARLVSILLLICALYRALLAVWICSLYSYLLLV